MADVEFSVLVQQGLLDVFLDDVGVLLLAALVLLLQDVVELVNLVEHLDAVASVGVLSRFDDPNVLLLFLLISFTIICLFSFRVFR